MMPEVTHEAALSHTASQEDSDIMRRSKTVFYIQIAGVMPQAAHVLRGEIQTAADYQSEPPQIALPYPKGNTTKLSSCHQSGLQSGLQTALDHSTAPVAAGKARSKAMRPDCKHNASLCS
jgi:hypothetical protein